MRFSRLILIRMYPGERWAHEEEGGDEVIPSSTIQGIPKIVTSHHKQGKRWTNPEKGPTQSTVLSQAFFFNFQICEAGNFYYLSHLGLGGTLTLQPWEGEVSAPSTPPR